LGSVSAQTPTFPLTYRRRARHDKKRLDGKEGERVHGGARKKQVDPRTALLDCNVKSVMFFRDTERMAIRAGRRFIGGMRARRRSMSLR
jgi:hypothetical protein